MYFMTRMSRYLLLLSVSVLLLLSCQDADRYVTVSGFAQGGTYRVTLNMRGVNATGAEVRKNVDAILQAVDNSLSGYNRNSLLSRFNAGEPVVPDSLFLEIYSFAYDIYRETGGAVDVAGGPLFDLWGFGFRNGETPSEEEVERVVRECGMNRLLPDMRAAVREDGTVDGTSLLLCEKGRFTGIPPRPQLNYNAIAQGYSCDLVARYLYSVGVKDMMVDIGEIFCDGRNPSGKPWGIGIDRPVDGNDVPGADIQGVFRVPAGPHGIVTSGNYRKFYVRDGKKYAHTIDPRTGRPVDHNLLSATIVADDAVTADAYATYCMVIGLEDAVDFLSSRTDLEGCLIYDDGGVFSTWCSEGFVMEQL